MLLCTYALYVYTTESKSATAGFLLKLVPYNQGPLLLMISLYQECNSSLGTWKRDIEEMWKKPSNRSIKQGDCYYLLFLLSFVRQARHMWKDYHIVGLHGSLYAFCVTDDVRSNCLFMRLRNICLMISGSMHTFCWMNLTTSRKVFRYAAA